MALGEITLGPVLFNWPAEQWRDFYYRVADGTGFDGLCRRVVFETRPALCR
jgi:hypothetical protein